MRIDFSRLSFRLTRSWGMRLLGVWLILNSLSADIDQVWDLLIAGVGIAAAIFLLQDR